MKVEAEDEVATKKLSFFVAIIIIASGSVLSLSLSRSLSLSLSPPPLSLFDCFPLCGLVLALTTS
jgi:hypothetical protein